jgi:uncharacterized protein YbjT (DUF2867 family)
MILVGATGGVGGMLMALLLDEPRCRKLVVLTRRPLGHTHEKLEERVVDFERPETWGSLRGEVLFSALGTTLRAAGSEAAQYKVDHDYQVGVAALAARTVPTYVLVSSNTANTRSPTFYGRMKGEVERDVSELPFKKICILRPGALEGNQTEERASDPLHPLDGKTLCRAALAAAFSDPSERTRRTFGPGDLLRLAGAAAPRTAAE